MKDIKKLLKSEGEKILPDDHVKENIKRDLGLSGEEMRAAYAHGGETAVRRRRGIWFAAAAAVLVAAVALGITLPLALGNNGPAGPTIRPGDKFTQITDADTFYAYGAVSVGAILSSESGTRPAAAGAYVLSAPAGADSRADETEYIEQINKYMALVENLLSDGNIRSEAASPSGEYAGYDYGMEVTCGNLLGTEISYTLYYDKIFAGGGYDGDESEANYAIEGVLLSGGGVYPVEGNYTEETEDGERENELYFTAYTAENSYIRVEQEEESETEDGETESERVYTYTIFEDGERVERMAVEYESEEENGETELEVLMTVRNYREDTSERLLFKEETENGERVIRVDADFDGSPVRFTIYIRGGSYHYEFEDGTSSDQNRPNRGDDDDDDDEDDDD